MRHNWTAVKYAARRLGTFAIVGFFIAVAWALVAVLGPVIETAFFPVYHGIVATKYQEIGESTLIVRIDFAKARRCRLAELAWYRIDPSGRPALLSEQTQESTPAYVRVSADGGHVDFLGLAYHSCGLIWPSRTIIGPIRIRVEQ